MAELAAALRELWAAHRGEVDANVARIEAAADVLTAGSLDTDTREAARRAAHQLAGTVGTFGFAEATERARALEGMLEREPAPNEAPALAELAARLRAALDDGGTEVDPATVVPGSQDCAPAPAAGRATTIVAFDDDPAILAAVAALAGERGWTVAGHGDPAALWDALERDEPDLLLLDIDMPGTTGIEVCRAVRADPRWAALPVVFLTSRRDAETVGAAFAAGADDLVNKPIVAAELLARIASGLERASGPLGPTTDRSRQ